MRFILVRLKILSSCSILKELAVPKFNEKDLSFGAEALHVRSNCMFVMPNGGLLSAPKLMTDLNPGRRVASVHALDFMV